jgi:hypothetical protein
VRDAARLFASAIILHVDDLIARTVANDGGRWTAGSVLNIVKRTVAFVLLLYDLLTRSDVGKRSGIAPVLDASGRRQTAAFGIGDLRDRVARIAGDRRMNRTRFRLAFEFGAATAASAVGRNRD